MNRTSALSCIALVGTRQGNGIGVAQLGLPMENNIDPLRFLTLREAAVTLQISQRTAQRMIQRKELPAFKVGGQWRLRESELVTWLERLHER